VRESTIKFGAAQYFLTFCSYGDGLVVVVVVVVDVVVVVVLVIVLVAVVVVVVIVVVVVVGRLVLYQATV